MGSGIFLVRVLERGAECLDGFRLEGLCAMGLHEAGGGAWGLGLRGWGFGHWVSA